MELYWIRHGMTKGNAERRYVGGRTDERLAEAGKKEIERRVAVGLYPQADTVFVSPMKRCRETAAIIYPDAVWTTVEGFRECDFGLFENKNEEELKGLAFYEDWIHADEGAAFPGGESPALFTERCVKALQELAGSGKIGDRAAFVVHGGVIMSILSTLDEKQKGFYGYYAENGWGYRCRMTWENGKMVIRDCQPLHNLPMG